MTDQEMVTVFKALGDENRIQILKLLLSGEKCACDLLSDLNITQPTLSHHMKILSASGLVNGHREGKWIHYSVSDEKVNRVLEYFESL